MKTVDEVVASWTPEEREQHKDLIEECRNRQDSLLEKQRADEKTRREDYLNQVGEVAEVAYFVVEGDNARIGLS